MQPRSALRISASDLKVQDRVVACESWAVPPPIHRVPVELIRNIFLLIKAIASPEEQQDNPHLGGIRTWMAVSHVCSRWRRIALETKDFWTYIPLRARNLGSTQLALERSAPLPISFNIGYRFSMQAKYQEAAMLALRELPRARELYLWLDNGKSKDDDAAREDFVNTVDEALYSNPAPLLERFESAKGYHDRCLFLGQVPQNLRVLMLRDSEQSSISNLLQAPLKSLQLLNCEIKVLEILQGQPGLQELTIKCPSDTYQSGDQPNSVELPKLRCLNVIDGLEDILNFLDRVHIPCDAEISTYVCNSMDSDNIHRILPLAQQYAKHASPGMKAGASYQSLTIAPPVRDGWGEGSSLTMHDPIPPSQSGQARLPRRMHVSMRNFQFTDDDHRELVGQFLVCIAPAVQDVCALTVRDQRLSLPQEWSELSSHLPSVRSISVEGCAAHGLALLLGKPDAQAAFPLMTTICLEHVNFADKIRDTRGFLAEDPVPFIDALLNGLRRRASSGQLIKLVTRHCTLAMEEACSFLTFMDAESIDWDGKLGTEGDEKILNSPETCY